MEVTVDKAHKNFEDTIKLKRSMNTGFLVLAQLLKENKDNKYYEQLGYETFESYVGTPELGLSRSHVYTLIQIYEKIVVELKVQPDELSDIEWTKLQVIVPSIDKHNKDELLENARSLSKSDLKVIVSGKEPDYDLTKCPVCNGTGKVKLNVIHKENTNRR